jgi:hypothetical protein
VLPFLEEAKESGVPAKLTKITRAVAGPQRSELRETYESHTPGAATHEDFEYFATIGLADRCNAVSTLSRILPVVMAIPHFVIEVERVIAVTEGDRPWSSVSQLETPLTFKDVGYGPAPTLPLEIHHGFDTLGDSADGLSVDQILSDVTQAGISVGGWFVFDRVGELCFRSNAFTTRSNYLAKAARQHEMLTDYLKRRQIACILWTTVEQILGIWNSTTQPRRSAN